MLGAAGGGIAAARLLAGMTSSERSAIAALFSAGLGVVTQAARKERRTASPQSIGTPYRAGPLTDDPSPLTPNQRGPHGEPPAGEMPNRLASAHRAFATRLDLALDTEQLRKNLLYYQTTWRVQRDNAYAELGPTVVADDAPRADEAIDAGFQAGRHRLAAIKDDVIARMDDHVATFRRAAEANGITVYEAADAADANRYVVELARRHGLRRAIKSKSMVSEEMHLNHALEDADIAVVETDFGEWIVQLDHDRPGHMISPIAHKNRYEVGAVISKGTGVATTGEDIGELASIARQQIRRAFLEADLGISGANALISSSGAIMLVTNEGNARLVTSLPRVHVAICGPEKIVPDMAAAMLQVRLLARSGTGQTQSVYTTFVNGPDAPEREVHIVLLDNGRSKLREDPAVASALRCIRCGACANVCPPYGVVAGHAFGYIYAGAIGLVTTAFHHGLENVADAQGLCLQCNACATVCPVEIPLPRQILSLRERVADVAGMPPLKRAALAVWREPRIFDRAARIAGALAAPLATDDPTHGRLLTRLPLGDDQSWRTPPAPARRPARDSLKVPPPAKAGPFADSAAAGTRVAYFIQCLTDRLYPEMAQAAVAVIAACAAQVVVPTDQHCCGLMADDSGDRAGAVALAKATIETLERGQADWIVTGATSCAIAIVHDYPRLLADEPDWLERARRIGQRTADLTSFLTKVARVPSGQFAHLPRHPVTLHNFCGAQNVLMLRDEPRALIRDVLGFELVEMEESGVCCGFGGSFALDHPRVARHVTGRKLANIAATGVATVVADNPGCIGHMRGALHAAGKATRVRHTAELIADRLREYRPPPA